MKDCDMMINYAEFDQIYDQDIKNEQDEQSFMDFKQDQIQPEAPKINQVSKPQQKQQGALSQSLISKFEVMDEALFDDILQGIDLSQNGQNQHQENMDFEVKDNTQKSLNSNNTPSQKQANIAFDDKNKQITQNYNNSKACAAITSNNSLTQNKNLNQLKQNLSQKSNTNKLTSSLMRTQTKLLNFRTMGTSNNQLNQSRSYKSNLPNVNQAEQSINISIKRKNTKAKKKGKQQKQAIIKPYYDYEDDDVELTEFIGRFDNLQPAFGYPLLSFKENANQNDDQILPDFTSQNLLNEKSESHSPTLRSRQLQSRNNKSPSPEKVKQNWFKIRQKLEPLGESVKRAYRTDDAFDVIMRSFTYGKKLQRMKMSKAMRAKIQKKEEERRTREEEARLLDILLHKKSKSIGGTVKNDRHQYFEINDAKTGIVEKDAQEEYSIKLVTYNSHKDLTYFRPLDWQQDNIKAGQVSEEQMKQIREYAALREQQKQEESQAILNKHESVRSSMKSSIGEEINMRDSFALDYNPDYSNDLQNNQQNSTIIGGESVSVQNLTKKALANLSQQSKNKSSKGKKKKGVKTLTSHLSKVSPGRHQTSITVGETTSVLSYYSKSTLRGTINKSQKGGTQINIKKYSNNQTLNSGGDQGIEEKEETYSTSSKVLSQITNSNNLNESFKKSPAARSTSSAATSSNINNNPVLRVIRTYSNNKVSQRMMELKIKEFKDKITQEQVEELQSRTFNIKDIPSQKKLQVIEKANQRYVFRDWKEIMNQTERIFTQNLNKTQPLNETAKPPKIKNFSDFSQKQQFLYNMIQQDMLNKSESKSKLNLRNRFQKVSDKLNEKANLINYELEYTKLQTLKNFHAQSGIMAKSIQSSTRLNKNNSGSKGDLGFSKSLGRNNFIGQNQNDIQMYFSTQPYIGNNLDGSDSLLSSKSNIFGVGQNQTQNEQSTLSYYLTPSNINTNLQENIANKMQQSILENLNGHNEMSFTSPHNINAVDYQQKQLQTPSFSRAKFDTNKQVSQFTLMSNLANNNMLNIGQQSSGESHKNNQEQTLILGGEHQSKLIAENNLIETQIQRPRSSLGRNNYQANQQQFRTSRITNNSFNSTSSQQTRYPIQNTQFKRSQSRGHQIQSQRINITQSSKYYNQSSNGSKINPNATSKYI
eukprot:403376130